jgi:hypothetical protein
MNKYDVALKLVLQDHADATMRAIAGAPVVRWHNIELPQTQLSRMDLLGETAARDLVHVELQSTNDGQIPLRMSEYYLKTYRLLGRFPYQVVLYVGEAPLSMPSVFRSPSLVHSFKIVDIRELDGRELLASPGIGDNIMAVLARLADVRAAMHQILERFASLGPQERRDARDRLLILTDLRRIDPFLIEEVQNVPITQDYEYDQFIKGEVRVVYKQMKKRFGAVPDWAIFRLSHLDAPEIEELAERLMDHTGTLEELLPPT